MIILYKKDMWVTYVGKASIKGELIILEEHDQEELHCWI